MPTEEKQDTRRRYLKVVNEGVEALYYLLAYVFVNRVGYPVVAHGEHGLLISFSDRPESIDAHGWWFLQRDEPDDLVTAANYVARWLESMSSGDRLYLAGPQDRTIENPSLLGFSAEMTQKGEHFVLRFKPAWV